MNSVDRDGCRCALSAAWFLPTHQLPSLDVPSFPLFHGPTFLCPTALVLLLQVGQVVDCITGVTGQSVINLRAQYFEAAQVGLSNFRTLGLSCICPSIVFAPG